MKLPTPTVGLSCALVAGIAALPATGKEDSSDTRLSLEVGAGAEYDSNISVDEIDASSERGDFALILDAELQLDQRFTDKLEMAFTYDYSQSNYHEFTRLDRKTHLLGIDFGADLGAVNSGLSLYYINARLDGEDFLEYYRGSPYVSGFIARNWFARGAYVYADKSIEQNPGRDAQSHAGELDLYFFRRGLRSYFNLGYKFKDEEAVAERFDYRAHNLKLRYIHRFELFGEVLKTELAWRYEGRDYRSITPSIGEEREDQRHRWKIDLEYPLLEHGAFQLYTGYADYDSNYPRAAYTQYIVGTRLSYRW